MDKMVSLVLDLYRKSVDQVGVSEKELFEAEKTLSVAITSEKVINRLQCSCFSAPGAEKTR